MSDTDELDRRWRFLLGESGEDERAALEEALLGDEAELATLQSAEDDLIDAYARGELPAERRRRFEEHFAVTPAQRARVAFAMALAARSAAGQPVAPAVATSPRPLRPTARRVRRVGGAWMGAAAALMLATLGGIGWRLIGRVAVPTAELTLSAKQVRGEAELPTVHVGRKPAPLSLTLLLDRDAAVDEPGAGVSQYEVTLRGPDAALRTLPARATPTGDQLTVALDEAELGDGDYELVARVRRGSGGSRELAAYAFRVTRP